MEKTSQWGTNKKLFLRPDMIEEKLEKENSCGLDTRGENKIHI